MEILADDRRCGGSDLISGDPITLSATFPAAVMVRICFHFPDAISRAERNAFARTDRTGIAFYAVRISPAKSNP